MRVTTPLYLLSGPTASGKTTVAHLLAERMGLRLLSVDSMMVYRGMDIGTAKPTFSEREQFAYAGLDLADPGDAYSTGKWIEDIRGQLDGRPTLAVGGTGLYFKAMMLGLEDETASERVGTEDVQTLRRELEQLRPGSLERLADAENPRRLERAIQWAREGKELPAAWQGEKGFPLPVLLWEREPLAVRITQRIQEMFTQGLLDETDTLRKQGRLKGTALQAIGYREAIQVLDGECTVEDAVEAMATRTRRYAKRQRTWFRNQMDSRWIPVTETDPPEQVADQVARIWEQTGPYPFS